MDIDKLDLFVSELLNKRHKKPKEAFDMFMQEWPLLKKGEREMLSGVVKGICLAIEEANLPMKTKLYWLAIVHYSEKPVIEGKFVEDDDDDIFPKLTLRKDVKGNQISKIFYRLKENGTITSSYDLIAEAISIIFPIEYSTAYNDMTQPSRLQKVDDIL